ncbi:MAG: adenylosuccinate lyase [Acidobacteriia bacterium]|nr:adenylosuccinate lyase [Terriglobia bacterium]
MIPRYTRPEMGHIWTEENKFQKWLDVEIAVANVQAARGLIPKSAALAIRRRGGFTVARINEIEAEVKHDVIAFTTAVSEQVGRPARYLHYGLTSSDVVDTANALLVREASRIIAADLKQLMAILRRRAFEFKHTPMVGRTHGIHAEPTTFGLKLAVWFDEIRRQVERFELAREHMRVGKLSGAVGTSAHLDPSIEEAVCKQLGLKAAPVSSQIIQRDRYAFFLSTLAVIASSLEKFALEIRNLQRTEVREVEEYFARGQKGSSAMPHKRNPVTCEQICGLARLMRAHAMAAMENVALWHERDISHSSVERIILPDSTVLMDYLLAKTASLIDRMFVYPERMKQNLELTRGLVFSGELLLKLTEKGVSREKAYQWVQQDAMKVWEDEALSFRAAVLQDQKIREHLSPRVIGSVFDVRASLRNVDRIFKRVFTRKKS